MAFASYTIKNDELFKAAIDRAAQVTKDLRIPFTLIQADFYRSEQSIFKLKSAGQYPDLSPKYAVQKQKKYGSKYPILFRTGVLAASVLGPNALGSISRVTAQSLTIGTAIPYGVYHQSDEARSKIPLRKFLFIGPEAPQFATSAQQGRTERWLNIMNDFVLKKMKKAGPFSG